MVKKRLACLNLSIIMAFTLLIPVNAADTPQERSPYLIVVDNTRFFSNENQVNDTWEYDAEYNTLYLNDYQGGSIRASGDLVIYSSGTVQVTGANGTYGYGDNGITCAGSLVIDTLDGKLSVLGGSGSVQGGDAVNSSADLYCVCRNNSSAYFWGGNSSGEGSIAGCALYAQNDFCIFQDSGSISAFGGDALNGYGGFGIFANNIHIWGDCEITGGDGRYSGKGIYFGSSCEFGLVNSDVWGGLDADNYYGNAIYNPDDAYFYYNIHAPETYDYYYDSTTGDYLYSYHERFRVNEYTLALNGNGGTLWNSATGTSLTNYYPKQYSLSDYIFHRDGYTQVAWANATGDLINLVDYFQPDRNTWLWAEWERTNNNDILLHAREGSFSDGDMYKKYSAQSVSLPINITYDNEYNYLLGWSDCIEASPMDLHVLGGRWYETGTAILPDVSAPIVLYAQSGDTGAVIYHPTQGEVKNGGNIIVQKNPASADLEEYVLNEYHFDAPAGAHLSGWAASEDSSKIAYTPGDTINVEFGEIQNLYAVWEHSYSIENGITLNTTLQTGETVLKLSKDWCDRSNASIYLLALYEGEKMIDCISARPQSDGSYAAAMRFNEDSFPLCKLFALDASYKPVQAPIRIDLQSLFASQEDSLMTARFDTQYGNHGLAISFTNTPPEAQYLAVCGQRADGTWSNEARDLVRDSNFIDFGRLMAWGDCGEYSGIKVLLYDAAGNTLATYYDEELSLTLNEGTAKTHPTMTLVPSGTESGSYDFTITGSLDTCCYARCFSADGVTTAESLACGNNQGSTGDYGIAPYIDSGYYRLRECSDIVIEPDGKQASCSVAYTSGWILCRNSLQKSDEIIAPLAQTHTARTLASVGGVEAFSDHWCGEDSYITADLSNSLALAYSLTISDKTVMSAAPNGYDANALLEWGEDPGLGIDILHQHGFTGSGAVVAYVDQPIAVPYHEQYGDTDIHYKNTVTAGGGENSMHGPAVLSLLAGRDIGTAPDAEVYYYGHAAWLADQETHAACLYQIIEQNKTLPEGKKITMVGFSDNIDESEDNADVLRAAVQACEDAGIMVWFCGEYGAASFLPLSDKSNPENLTKASWGGSDPDLVYVPAGSRTTAATMGDADYIYWSDGGLSWTMPYMLGLYGTAVSIDPTLTQADIRSLVTQTAYTNSADMRIVNPVEFIAAVLERVGGDTEAASLRADAKAQNRYLYAVMDTAALSEEDLGAISSYLSAIADATVLVADAAYFADAESLYAALKTDAATRGGEVVGVQIFGTPDMVPAFSVAYRAQMLSGADEGDTYLTDLFYGNFENDPAVIGSGYNVLDHFANGWDVELAPHWPVARLPLKAGEYEAFFDKYDAYAVASGLTRETLVNFSNPIFASADHIDDMGAFLNRMHSEFDLLDDYRLYGNLRGDYPVTTNVLYGFTAENLAFENAKGACEFLINSHGQRDNIDCCYFSGEEEQRESLMNSDTINSVLDANPYYLDCWTCNNGYGMTDNLTTAALNGKCLGMFSATTIISNNGVNCAASLAEMQNSNFYYFYYNYFKALHEGKTRSQAFFAAQSAYAAALIADSANGLRAEGNYQFNLNNLLAYENFGVLEPNAAALALYNNKGYITQAGQSVPKTPEDHGDSDGRFTPTPLTCGTPVGTAWEVPFDVGSDCTIAGQYKIYGLTAQQLDNGHVRLTLDYQAPAGMNVDAFNPPDGDLFMLYGEKTTGNRQTFVFDIPYAYLASADTVTMKFFGREEEACQYVFASAQNILSGYTADGVPEITAQFDTQYGYGGIELAFPHGLPENTWRVALSMKNSDNNWNLGLLSEPAETVFYRFNRISCWEAGDYSGLRVLALDADKNVLSVFYDADISLAVTEGTAKTHPTATFTKNAEHPECYDMTVTDTNGDYQYAMFFSEDGETADDWSTFSNPTTWLAGISPYIEEGYYRIREVSDITITDSKTASYSFADTSDWNKRVEIPIGNAQINAYLLSLNPDMAYPVRDNLYHVRFNDLSIYDTICGYFDTQNSIFTSKRNRSMTDAMDVNYVRVEIVRQDNGTVWYSIEKFTGGGNMEESEYTIEH